MTADQSNWVSLAEAARILTAEGDRADRTTLSRYCDNHGLEKRRQGRAALIDLNALRVHRRENYTREVMSGRTLEPSGPAQQQAQTTAQPAPAAADNTLRLPDAQDPARREKAAKAEMAELSLAERQGKLVLITEVDAGMAEAIAEIRSIAMTEARQTAKEMTADLGLTSDQVRVLQVSLKRFARKIESGFITRCAELTGEVREPKSAARKRLETLTIKAMALRGMREDAAEMARGRSSSVRALHASNA
jgi:hypothetical protein